MNESAVKEAPILEGALWPALREYWHVVAYSEDVPEDKIFPFTLLDEEIVICRLGGKLVAFSDLCVHRGTPISLGTIERDRVVCCYHGWEYNAEGKCTRIPSIPDEHPIPKRACLKAFSVQERYGMIWVCLSATPRAPIPECPLAEDPAYKLVFQNKWIWKAGAARATENFFDQAHFAFGIGGFWGVRIGRGWRPPPSNATETSSISGWMSPPIPPTRSPMYADTPSSALSRFISARKCRMGEKRFT